MLIDRYLLRRFLTPLTYCLAAFSMLVVIWDLFDHFGDIIKAKPSFFLIVRYYIGVLCPALEYLLPASLLLATIYTLWQLTRNNELIAMRVNGISLHRIMLPFLWIGLACSIFNGIIGATLAPRAAAWTAEFYADKFKDSGESIRTDQPYYNSTSRRQWMIGELDLRNPSRLLRVKVTQERTNGTRAVEMQAQKAEWLDSQWWLYGVQEQWYDEHGNPVGALSPQKPNPYVVQQVTFLNEKPADFVSEAKSWEYYTIREMLRYFRSHKGISDKAVAEKKFQLHRRLAMPWACLIVTLFGIPAGSRSARHNPLSGVFLAMGFFLGFYAVGQIGAYLGIKQIIWTWLGAWLSNMIFMATGISLLIKMR
jgi:lipopolysaccharide export system permease protein